MPHSSTPATLPSQPHASLHCASRTTEAFTNVIPPPEDVGSTSCTGHPAQGLRCWSHTDLIVGHQLTPHRSQQANWPALPSTRQDYNALYHIATNREGEMPLVFRLLLTPWSSTDASKGIPYQVSPTDINADLRCSISCLGQLHNGTLREGIHHQDSQRGRYGHVRRRRQSALHSSQAHRELSIGESTPQEGAGEEGHRRRVLECQHRTCPGRQRSRSNGKRSIYRQHPDITRPYLAIARPHTILCNTREGHTEDASKLNSEAQLTRANTRSHRT